MTRTQEQIGWLLFIASACFFTAASWRSGDVYGLAGSLLFLLACFFFIRLRPRAAEDDERGQAN